MSEVAASSKSKALLLVESNVEDAFAFSQALKASGLPCEFYMVAGADAAKRYLAAGAADVACVPTIVVVSQSLGRDVGAELIQWIAARGHLRSCVVLTLADAASDLGADESRALRKPVSADAIRAVLEQRMPDGSPLGTVPS